VIDLSCRGVSKRYRFRERGDSREFWALRDLTFDVQRGEALGVIGHNGAGKSTLLKLLASITAPTEGEIVISGRLSALIELGSGFHPELTGRENVYLSGAILGMTRREISAKFDRIVQFAGVTPFIDVPVKRYSSGMYVRLGFAIAAHLDPDLLLIDEVLAVGDAAFQEQCFSRIQELRRGGTTAVFISHDLDAVERLCDRVLLLEHGRLQTSGPPADVIRNYRKRLLAHEPPPLPTTHTAVGLTLLDVRTLDETGRETSGCRTGDPLIVRVAYEADADLRDGSVEILFYSADGRVLHCQQTTALSNARLTLASGRGAVEFSIDELALQPGDYMIVAAARDVPSQQILSWTTGPSLSVRRGKMVRGLFYMPHRWRHLPHTDSTSV
jgi:ABC-type polysaccharide/polyol phosphate transport system ATPase subunit